MTASVLITVYNCWPIALQAIENHLKFGGDLIEEIIVIDDCSTENIPDVLPSKVRLIRNETNQGYVKSVNIGFREIHSDLVILFDADSIPLNDYGNYLSEYFTKNKHVGAIGFYTVNDRGEQTGMIEPEPNEWSLLLGQQLYARAEHFFAKKTIVIYSCALVVQKIAVDQINGFDETFDFLDADADFSMRLTRAGWQLEMIDTLKSKHQGGGSPQATSKRVLRHYVNRHKLLQKHDKWRKPKLYKNIITARLNIELFLLNVAGTLKYKDPAIRNDKLKGRKDILSFIKQNY